MTLTINPGVQVKFNGNYSLNIDGALNAQGTSANKITFTSNQAVPTPGYWSKIKINQGSLSIIKYSNIKYSSSGIFIDQSSPVITNDTFQNNTGYPVHIQHTVSNGSSPQMSNNTYTGNGVNGIEVEGHDDGLTRVFFYSFTLTKDNAPYYFNYDSRFVYNGIPTVLTIEPGVELRFAAGTGLQFSNFLTNITGLVAQGTAANPIKFTSAQAVPVAGNWIGIRFEDGTGFPSIMDHCIVEYAGQTTGNSVSLGAVPVQITNSTIKNGNGYGVYVAPGGSPTLNNNAFQNNTSYAVHVQHTINANATSSPILSNNTYIGNGVNGIEIEGHDNGNGTRTIFYSFTLTKDNAPYYFNYDTQINGSGTPIDMTIEPGVEIKFGSGAGLRIAADYGMFGTLIAQGTAVNPIRFTSVQAVPAAGNWVGVRLQSASGASILDHCIVEYAGQTNDGAVVIDTIGVSVSNSEIKNNNTGIRVISGYPLVENNTVQNNVIGILGEAVVNLLGNIIQSNGVGVKLTNDNADLLNNTISNNTDKGIYLYGPALTYFSGNITANNIYQNTNYDLYADEGDATITINAQNNYWGTTNMATIEQKIFHNVDNSARPIVNFSNLSGQLLISLLDNISLSPVSIFLPLGETATISYELDQAANVTVQIFELDTDILKRTILNNVVQPAGINNVVWDGKNDLGQNLFSGAFYFKIIASNANSYDVYLPLLVTGPVSLINGTTVPANFDPYKGETTTITYDLVAPAKVTLKTGQAFPNYFYGHIIQNIPQDTLNNIVIWDGRDEFGKIVPSTFTETYGFTELLPDNVIIVKNDFRISNVFTTPYAIYPDYGNSTKITFNLSHDAVVTVTLISDANVVVKTILNAAALSSGPHMVEWSGLNISNDVVTAEEHYRVKIEAIHAFGETATAYANISVFK